MQFRNYGVSSREILDPILTGQKWARAGRIDRARTAVGINGEVLSGSQMQEDLPHMIFQSIAGEQRRDAVVTERDVVMLPGTAHDIGSRRSCWFSRGTTQWQPAGQTD